MHRKTTKRKAFTLSEAIMVLAILGVIAALGVGVLRYMNVSQFPTLKAVFKNDLATSLATMNLDESIADISNTKELIEKAQEYYDFSNEVKPSEAFADLKTGYKDAAGNTVDLSNFGNTDGDANFYAFASGSGTSVTIKYVKNNNVDLDAFAETTGKINGSQGSYEVSNKTLNFVTGFYDVNGPAGPNKIGEDAGFIMPAFVLNKDLGEYITVENGAIVRKSNDEEKSPQITLVDEDGVFNTKAESTVTEDPDCPPGTVSDGTDICACPYNDTYCQERGKKFDKENCGCRNANDETECNETNQTFDNGRCVCGPDPKPGDLCGKYSVNSAIGDYNNCTCKCNQQAKLKCETAFLNLFNPGKCTWDDKTCDVTCGQDAVDFCNSKANEYGTAVPDASNFCACKCGPLKQEGEITDCKDDAEPTVIKTEISDPDTTSKPGYSCTTKKVTYQYTQTCQKKRILAGTLAEGCSKTEDVGSPFKRQKPGTEAFTEIEDPECVEVPGCPDEQILACKKAGREIMDDCTCGLKIFCSADELAQQPCPEGYEWQEQKGENGDLVCRCVPTGKCPKNGEADCKAKYPNTFVYTDDCRCIDCQGAVKNVTNAKCNLSTADKKAGKTCASFSKVDNKTCGVRYNPNFKFCACDSRNTNYHQVKTLKNGNICYGKTGSNSCLYTLYKQATTVSLGDGTGVRVAANSCVYRFNEKISNKHGGTYKTHVNTCANVTGTYDDPDNKITDGTKTGTLNTKETSRVGGKWDPILLIYPTDGNPANGQGNPQMLKTEDGKYALKKAKLYADSSESTDLTWLARQDEKASAYYFFLVKPETNAGTTPVWEKTMFTDFTGYATGLLELQGNYDRIKDGVINELDPDFHKLKLWADKNANGSIDSGELFGVDDKRIIEISTKYSIRSASTGEVEQSTAAVTALTGSYKAAIRLLDNGPAYTIAVKRTTAAVPNKVLYESGNYYYEFNGSSYILRYIKDAQGNMVPQKAYSGNHPLRNIAPANIAQFINIGGKNYRIDTYKIIDIMFTTPSSEATGVVYEPDENSVMIEDSD